MRCPDCKELVVADIAAASRGYRCMPCWRKLGRKTSSAPFEGMALDSDEYRRWWLAQRRE